MNRKKALQYMLKGLHFSFCIKTENEMVQLKVENDLFQTCEMNEKEYSIKRIEGKEDVVLSMLSGKVKLRKAVENNEIVTTLTFRELLLLEALFYLARPEYNQKPLSLILQKKGTVSKD